LLHLFNPVRPALSVNTSPDVYMRVDLTDNQVVGLQLEHFVRVILRQRPELEPYLAVSPLYRLVGPGGAGVQRRRCVSSQV
jgi:hypothetical protein